MGTRGTFKPSNTDLQGSGEGNSQLLVEGSSSSSLRTYTKRPNPNVVKEINSNIEYLEKKILDLNQVIPKLQKEMIRIKTVVEQIKDTIEE